MPQSNNAEAAEVERFYKDLQDLLELTPPKDVLFIIGDWNAKVESQACFLWSGVGYVGELLELQQGCEGPFGSSRG